MKSHNLFTSFSIKSKVGTEDMQLWFQIRVYIKPELMYHFETINDSIGYVSDLVNSRFREFGTQMWI